MLRPTPGDPWGLGRITYETNQVLLVGGEGGFLGDFPYSPHLTIYSAQNGEIILTVKPKLTKQKQMLNDPEHENNLVIHREAFAVCLGKHGRTIFSCNQ